MLRLSSAPPRERAHDVVGGYGSIAVDEMVQVAGGEARAGSQLAVGHARLRQERLDRRSETLLAESSPARHYDPFLPRSATANRCSSPVVRSLKSTFPSSRLFFPAVMRIGQPIRSASA